MSYPYHFEDFEEKDQSHGQKNWLCPGILTICFSTAVSPVFQLVVMIQPLKVYHAPLIYSRQVNFVMFSFKLWFEKNWNDKKHVNIAIKLFPLYSQKLVLSFKKCSKNPILAENELFYYFASRQRVADVDVL